MNQLEIEIGDTVEYSVGSNTGAGGVCIDIHARYGTYRISWDDYNASWCSFNDLTLIKKGNKEMKEFTKSDLKTGMFVKNRHGHYKIVIGEFLSGLDTSTLFANFSESLISNIGKGYDIVAVYNVHSDGYLRTFLQGNSLTLIWERTEQTEAQKEMAILQEQAKALQEQITKLQSTL
jgi:hypothetical protein